MTTIIGIIGAGVVLSFCVLEQVNEVNNKNLWYGFGNFFGSVLLIIYAILLSSIPFMVLNTVWAIFSLRDIIVDLKCKKNYRK